MLWLSIVLWCLATLAALALVLPLFGAARWHARTRALRTRLEAARAAVTPTRFDIRELEGLPAPVQRYFRAALTNGQAMIAAVTVEQAGTFNMHEAGGAWSSLSATQRVLTRRPGFLWDGKVVLVPGLSVRVHDAYIAGEGILYPAVLGLLNLGDLHGSGDIARGELLRFFAEAAWYPTALLPTQGVRWEAVDEQSARATLTDSGLSVTMLFRFRDDGLIASVHTDARGRTVAGRIVPTRWEGSWGNYALSDGMRVPMECEVSWQPPEGPRPYLRCRITRLEYEFAD